MGRSYWYECSRCGYRAKISGRADRGFQFSVQSIVCRDCRELFDAVTGLRVAAEPLWQGRAFDLRRAGTIASRANPASTPPSFQAALNRLPPGGGKSVRWLQFKLQCPNSPRHRIETWNDPAKCPKCGVFLEKGALPFRIWE